MFVCLCVSDEFTFLLELGTWLGLNSRVFSFFPADGLGPALYLTMAKGKKQALKKWKSSYQHCHTRFLTSHDGIKAWLSIVSDRLRRPAYGQRISPGLRR